jgi:pyruvate,orthophosphate dikinase
MFFEGDRILAMREMILADNESAAASALAKLLPYQRERLHRHLRGDEGPAGHDPPARPAAARVPARTSREPSRGNCRKLGMTPSRSSAACRAARDEPDARHRGCRLGVTYPEILEMQARAIFEAACNVQAKKGIDVHPEIMIPLVGTPRSSELQARP